MKKIVLLEQEYNVIKDDNDSYDNELVISLATDYFKPYDYILGDFSYGKLRLKGFYRDDNKKSTKINRYSEVENYIKNFCSFGCKYFILEKIKK